MLDKGFFFLDVEDGLYIDRLIDEMLYLLDKFFGQPPFACQILENFMIFADLFALSPYTAYQIAETAYIVRESDTADDLDENNPYCFMVIGWDDISESDCQHDCRCPIVGPNVSLEPLGILNVPDHLPVCIRVSNSHKVQNNCDNMCESQVEKHDFEERPVFLVVKVLKYHLFKPIQFVDQVGDLQDEQAYQSIHELSIFLHEQHQGKD